MGWFSKDPVEEACKSDSYLVLTKEIGTDKSKFNKAVKYLKSKGNLNLLLKILLHPWGREELMKTLMELNENDPKVRTEISRLGADGYAPVHIFAMAPDAELFIRLLANNGANLDILDSFGQTALLIASNQGCVPTIQMLLNNGVRDLNRTDEKGWTALHFACQMARPEIVAQLLEEGANVNALTKDGFMPIHVAISTYSYTQHSPTSPDGLPWNPRDALMCTQLLIHHGADMDYKSPLGYAAKDVIKPRKE